MKLESSGDMSRIIRRRGLPDWAHLYSPEPNTGCWIWCGHIDPRLGYGHAARAGNSAPAHRVMYERLVGPIPEELDLDHLCRNRWCVNPRHLEPVTHRENARRGNAIMGVNARKTHCWRGHLFDEANTHRRPNGNRDCKACRRMRWDARARGERLDLDPQSAAGIRAAREVAS